VLAQRLTVRDDHVLDRTYGIEQWIKRDRSLENTDVIAWYTLGVHRPPKDWPVMPVAYAGFMLKPAGFFEQNPTMDVASLRSRDQCCE
jgi:primary-amine oxidase